MISIKNKKEGILLAAVLSTSAIVLVSLVFSIATKPTANPVTAVVPADKKQPAGTAANVDDYRFGTPKRLVISKIGVDTSIEQMGLTADGDMDAPKTDEDTGWYKYGPNPGNVGSAVIAGHLGATGQAVFGRLNELVRGDTVSVTDDTGQTGTFVVTETRMYEKDAAPSEVFTSTSGAHLNLITCEGNWEASLNTYSKRLVVFTDKVE